MDRFPLLEREKWDGMNSVERQRNNANTSAQKAVDQNHNREVIFALPSLQLHLKTEHLQGGETPDVSGSLKSPYGAKLDCRFFFV